MIKLTNYTPPETESAAVSIISKIKQLNKSIRNEVKMKIEKE